MREYRTLLILNDIFLFHSFYTAIKSSIQSMKGGGCFASDAKVKVKNPDGRVVVKPLSDLMIGDLAQSYDHETNAVIFSPVYFITYQDEDGRLFTLRELFYQGSDGKMHSLRLSPKHLVYSNPNIAHPESPFESKQPPLTPVMSEKVNVGDTLWMINEMGILCPRSVVDIGEVVSSVRHPLTQNHVIIVNDVLASVHLYNEWLLRRATLPLRLLYKISPNLNEFWIAKKAVKAWDYVEYYILE